MATTFTHPDLSPDAVVDALEHAGFEVEPAASLAPGRPRHLRRTAVRGRPAPRAPPRPRGGAGPPRRAAARRPPGWRVPPRRGGPRASRAVRSARRLAEVTKERALVPLLTVTSHARRAQRRDRRGKATVVAELHEDVAPTGGACRVAARAARRRRPRRRAGADRHAAPLARARAHRTATWPPSSPTGCGTSLGGTSSSPTVALDAHGARLVRLPAGAGQPRRHRSRRTGPAPSRTSTRSSCTTSASPCAAPASVLQGGQGRAARRRPRCATRRRSATLGQQTGPARDLDVYIVGWDDYVAPLGLAGDPGLAKVRREIERQRAAAHRELSKLLASDASRRVLDELAHLARRPRRRGAVEPPASAGWWRAASRRRRRRCSPMGGPSPPRPPASASTTSARTPSGCATSSSASGRSSPPMSARRS